MGLGVGMVEAVGAGDGGAVGGAVGIAEGDGSGVGGAAVGSGMSDGDGLDVGGALGGQLDDGGEGSPDGGAGASDGGRTDGGMGGGPGGGEGGEGGDPWTDEATLRLIRISDKARAAGCDDYSTCVEIFRWGFFGLPWCGPVAERLLTCLDTEGTTEEFQCVYGKPWIYTTDSSPCAEESEAVRSRGCFMLPVEGAAWVKDRSR